MFLPSGEEIGQLSDNFAHSVLMAKETSMYRKLPISGCVIHPEGKWVWAEIETQIRGDGGKQPSDAV